MRLFHLSVLFVVDAVGEYTFNLDKLQRFDRLRKECSCAIKRNVKCEYECKLITTKIPRLVRRISNSANIPNPRHLEGGGILLERLPKREGGQ